MRAVICERPGPPGVLKVVEQPTPQPGPGEVLIAVAYAAVTFVETQIRAGIVPPGGHAVGRAFPLVLGNGVAGTVIAAGPGVDPDWIGATVTVATGGAGGYAEFAVAPARELHRVPEGLDIRKAAALLADGRTALALARAARLAQGERALITAAAGGVGSLLVQLAHAAGAFVVGLAGGARKLGLARARGADFVADYRRPGWQRQVLEATGGLGVDVAFDGVGGEVGAGIVDLIRKGGRYLPHGMASGALYEVPPEKARSLEIIPLRSVLSGPQDSYALVEEALALAASGTIEPLVGQVFPLERAAEAHAAIEARKTVGKTLLFVGRDGEANASTPRGGNDSLKPGGSS